MDIFVNVLMIIFAAAAGEGIIEFLIAPVVTLLFGKEEQLALRTIINNLASALLGVLLAIGCNLCAFSIFQAVETLPFLDNVITGLLIGRGSNWVHNLFKRFLVDMQEKLAAIEATKNEVPKLP